MLALWALFLLSALIISWALDIDSRLRLSGSANRVLEAEALACSGAEVALHPQIKPDSPNLSRRVPPHGSYEVRITGEGGRLNLNWLLAGEDPVRLEILRRYLEIKGIDLNERDQMIDCLLDWVDPDALVRLNGAEKEDNYRPTNTSLSRIEELKKVRGWEQFTSVPGWDDELTVNSTGSIDLLWAGRNLLLSLPGMTEALVGSFLQMRSGPDGVDGTEDDAQFRNKEECLRVGFGFGEEQSKAFTNLVTFRDQRVRIVSVGRSAQITRTVQMVVHKTDRGPLLITWKEL